MDGQLVRPAPAELAAGRAIDAEPMPAGEALRRLLRALGLDPRAIAEEEQERAGQLRAILAERLSETATASTT